MWPLIAWGWGVGGGLEPEGSKLHTDSPVLKGTAVGGHSMLVTPLQPMHTHFGRSHDYKMKN